MGERAAGDRIRYGIPDVLGVERHRYAGRRVLVVGSGHSALNALLDLTTLAAEAPDTAVTWVIRRTAVGQLLGGGRPDQLEERGKLGIRVRSLLDQGRLKLVLGFRVDRIRVTDSGVVVSSGERFLDPVDEVIAATGFRPDWSILSEVRLDLDPAVESPRALAPLIDPNVHSCGTVPPHGAEELKQPDANMFVIGMKSYGRAPTFLLLTGYEQARSVVRAIAGDWEAARRVELVLPERGVCSTDASTDGGVGCCGTSNPEPVPVTIGLISEAKAIVQASTPAGQ
jgi:Pyridine nucleotide-disulphide oxidoreductase